MLYVERGVDLRTVNLCLLHTIRFYVRRQSDSPLKLSGIWPPVGVRYPYRARLTRLHTGASVSPGHIAALPAQIADNRPVKSKATPRLFARPFVIIEDSL